MNRVKVGMVALTMAVSVLVGCKHQLFVHQTDYEEAMSMQLRLGAPTDIENNPAYTQQTAMSPIPPSPSTVSNPDRPVRYLTLPEAISLALENGNVGSQNQNFPGVPIDSLVSLSGRTVFGSDNIRVFALDPAIAGADIEASLSKFDARFVNSITWNKRDDAIANILGNFQNGDQANLTTGIYKPLPTGGVAGITWTTDYNYLSQPPAVIPPVPNPTWRPRLALQIEQPLLRDYGVEINQLNFSHPGSLSIPQFRPGGARVEGILIARLRFEQTQTEFERVVNHLLLNVEFAYWNLYAAYGALFARDQAVVDAADLWQVFAKRAAIQRPADLERTRAQLEAFRAQRFTALGQVIEAERQLRSLIGMHDDGTRIVPIDNPTLAAFTPDWAGAVVEMKERRPELLLARQDLKFRQFDLLIQKNQLKPDLRVFGSYDVNGLGTALDGPSFEPDGFGGVRPRNALASLARNQFNTWQVGLRLDVPIGFRDAHSAARVARLNLYRSYVQLVDTERKAELLLRNQYSRLDEFQSLIRTQKAQYDAASKWYDLLKARRDIELELTGFLEQILNAQRTRSEALAAQFRAIADYNNALAGWQFAKGTIMQYDNVAVAEAPLPNCAAVRAAEHMRERTAALVMRKRSQGEYLPGLVNIEQGPDAGLPPPAQPVASMPEIMRKLSNNPPAAMPDLPSSEIPAATLRPASVAPYTPQ